MSSKFNSSVITVFAKINKKPKAFFKKLAQYWFYEMVFSEIIPAYYEKEEVWVIQDVMKVSEGEPLKTREILNTIRCLEELYPFDTFDYGEDSYVSFAIKIRAKYRKQFLEYIDRKIAKKVITLSELCKYTPTQVFLEYSMRGFIPLELVGYDDKKDYYVASTRFDLVFPKRYASHNQALISLKEWGITNYVTIKPR